VDLTGNMNAYRWGLAGDAGRLDVTQGERIRVTFRNRSRMWHPMHFHGHTFALADLAGARKDTVNVLPGESVAVDFDADNPGQWMLHCHNTYHLSTGMATTVSYRRT
jgi:FtsP/CotA-like multicopper oxidase with cupredoxin domain